MRSSLGLLRGVSFVSTLTRENSVVGGVELGVDDRRGPDEEEDEPVPILLGIHDAPKRQETCGGHDGIVRRGWLPAAMCSRT
jgi:hypothetical protein